MSNREIRDSGYEIEQIELPGKESFVVFVTVICGCRWRRKSLMTSGTRIRKITERPPTRPMTVVMTIGMLKFLVSVYEQVAGLQF